MNDLETFKIKMNFSIRQAIKQMDEAGRGFCVCVDKSDNVIGVISDGDFRHAVHNGIQLDENVTKIVNRIFFSVQKKYNIEEVNKIFDSTTMVRQIPVLENGKLIDVITAEEFYGLENSKKKRTLDNPVIIMAGGEGTRLDPFTRILPKSLVPLGNEPVIKVIMHEFAKYGMNNFYISLRDKEKMVRAYFHDHNMGYHINYIHENKPLGTAGALRYLEGKMKISFFVSNCDIIIRSDYGAFYDFHKNGAYALSMVGSMRQYVIPYGVCETDSRGELKSIREKPHYDLLVSTGMYLLEPTVLQYIPEDAHFNMTDLIRKVQDDGLKVGIFPVSEKSWTDVGQLSEYKEVVNKLSF